MMRLLLDTHALIWWWKNAPQLGADAKSAMTDPGNQVFVSAASGWEVAIKVRRGHLPAFKDCLPAFTDDVLRDGFTHLDVTARHAIQGGSLPGTHKDPFDRLLAGQALLEDLVVVTRDKEIAAFGCKVLW